MRILLVEDEASVRLLTARVLHSLGYVVHEASSAVEALQFMRGYSGPPIELLLTDVVLPQFNGGVLAEQLVALRPDLKVLFISGYTDNAIVQQGWLRDDVAFLQKPFSPAALAQKVREVLDG